MTASRYLQHSAEGVWGEWPGCRAGAGHSYTQMAPLTWHCTGCWHGTSPFSVYVQLKMVPTCFLPCLSDVLLFSVHATPAEFLYLCLVVDTLTKYLKEQPQGCGLGYGLIMFIGCCQAVKRKPQKRWLKSFVQSRNIVVCLELMFMMLDRLCKHLSRKSWRVSLSSVDLQPTSSTIHGKWDLVVK